MKRLSNKQIQLIFILYKEGIPQTQIAEIVNCSQSGASHVLINIRTPSNDQKKEMIELYESGVSIKEIKKASGFETCVIKTILRAEGLYVGPKKKR